MLPIAALLVVSPQKVQPLKLDVAAKFKEDGECDALNDGSRSLDGKRCRSELT